MISPNLCVKCKGKLLCGLSCCPILQRYSTQSRAVANICGDSFSGSSPPSVFVSWKNYPNVSIAPLSPSEITDSAMFDAPEKWFGLPAEQIVSYREQLIVPRKKINAAEAANPSNELAQMQELVMAAGPTAVEIRLKEKPVPQLSFHQGFGPLGPSGRMLSMRLRENPSIPRKIDGVVSDTDLKADSALLMLYEAGFSITTLHKLLSAGVLGIGKNRRLVPTRWSISAADSAISLNIINEKVKNSPPIEEFLLFHSAYQDNDFWVLLAKGNWCFEQLECWLPGGIWSQGATGAHIAQDHEFYAGRSGYASNVEGAYYSARLAVAEYLSERKIQSGAVVFREIGGGYNIPLGVWVIRETVRDAMRSRPLSFSSLGLALAFLGRKLRVPLQEYKKESALLDSFLHQKKLSDFS